ncbi:hypothetical protein AAHH67_03845 [Niallia circulans]
MKKFLSTLGMALIGGVFGGALMLALLSQEWSITNILISVVCFLAFYIIHIILHEGGHLIFGKLTGYSLVSFRVFSWMVVATKDGLKWKKLHMPGTLGQCLMAPPKYVKGKYPFKLYLCGGVIINFLSSLVVGGIAWIIYGNAFPIPVTLFVLLGLFIGVTNIIPYGFNDGMTLKMAWSNEKSNGSYLVNSILTPKLPMAFLIKSCQKNYLHCPMAMMGRIIFPSGDCACNKFAQWTASILKRQKELMTYCGQGKTS